ncbi:MAG: type III-B CRISPR-associated protein Cas10/Cmr2 [Opitutales bacterium]
MTQHLHFTIGPVQGFVAQSRRTRDLWASSWLLSKLSGKAMLSALGSDQANKLILPNLAPDKLRDLCGKEHASLPNRFVLESPNPVAAGKAASEAIHHFWENLGIEVWDEFLKPIAADYPETRKIWDRQVKHFWEIAWIVDSSGENFRLLEQRKNWRTPTPTVEPGDHCAQMPHLQELSGWNGGSRKHQKEFWENLRDRSNIGILDLEEKEQLCAIAFIKRFFPKLNKYKETLDAQNWPSTLYLAAVPWLKAIKKKPEIHQDCGTYAQLVTNTNPAARGERNAKIKSLKTSPAELGDFPKLDGNFFYPRALENERATPLPDDTDRKELLTELGNLRKKIYGNSGEVTSPFYALLLMDGDKMGVLLRDAQKEGKINQATDALITFAGEVPDIVENHDGRCVYAGGDDVLAMLPIDQALACASELEIAYRKSFEGLPEPFPKKATLSGALIFAHYKTAFSSLLREAHTYLDKVAKDRTGRASIAIAIQKGSGLACLYAAPWEFLRGESQSETLTLEALKAKLVTNRDEASKGEEKFTTISGSFLYHLRDKLGSLGGDTSRLDKPGSHLEFSDADFPLEDFLLAEYLVGKLLSKKKEFAKAQREQARKTMQTLLRSCRMVTRNSDKPVIKHDGTHGTASTFSLDGPLVARFLVEGGKEIES